MLQIVCRFHLHALQQHQHARRPTSKHQKLQRQQQHQRDVSVQI